MLPPILSALRIPVVASPMFIVSGPELVIAQCKAGIVGSFPALNAREQDGEPPLLDAWLTRIAEELDRHNQANPDHPAAPFAVNQIVHRSNARLERDIEICHRHRVPIWITSLGARVEVICGGQLLKQNFPLIHAVGRAAACEPRLIDIRLGDAGPMLTIVGKGVCFDTGGLNLKPGASMGLMKKDMGGAATALGLLKMLARSGAASGLRLRVLIPAVENSVAGNAFRPGDVLASRKGLSVEVNNTDAEGRLVLADALTYAAEESPDLMISLATLTGAARVALGPDLPPLYCDDDATATAIQAAGMQVGDPVWRMPFWDAYESLIEPGIADLDNAPAGGFAGAITAALFLRRFAGPGRYAHFDIYGWQPTAAPGRPKGGVGQGARAILAALPRILA